MTLKHIVACYHTLPSFRLETYFSPHILYNGVLDYHRQQQQQQQQQRTEKSTVQGLGGTRCHCATNVVRGCSF